jgi:hypothetical protein
MHLALPPRNHAGNQQDVDAPVCAPWPLNGGLFHAPDDSVVIELGFSDTKCKSCVCLTGSRGLILNFLGKQRHKTAQERYLEEEKRYPRCA